MSRTFLFKKRFWRLLLVLLSLRGANPDVDLDNIAGQLSEEVSIGDDQVGVVKAGAGELTPNNTGSAITATRAGQRMASSAISNRSNANRTGVNSGEMISSGGFWFQYAYSEAEQDKKDGVFGYEAETSGFSLGMDTGLVDMDTTVGFAYSYAKGDIKGKGAGSGSSMDTKNYIFSLYGSFAMDNMFVDGRISYSSGENNGHRTVGGERIKAKYDNEGWPLTTSPPRTIAIASRPATQPASWPTIRSRTISTP